MESNDTFGFGSKPCMKEVPAGATAVFSFRSIPALVETEYGEKFSFPITLISHDSHSTLPFDCDWITKSDVGKELWNGLNAETPDSVFVEAYKQSEWQLTRFDTGTYWIDSL